MSEMQIAYGNTPELVQDALIVRRAVFIAGQGVLESRDLDGQDDSPTRHFVGYVGGEPVGVARMRPVYLGFDTLGTFDAKIERVGVLEEQRGHDFGIQLMAFIMDRIKDYSTVRNAVLESQTHAAGFYERFGFQSKGKVFKDAGIDHIKMVKVMREKPIFRGQRFSRSGGPT